MATSTLPPTPYELDAAPVVIEFEDNFLLIDLCGAHDRNLADVELKLGVQVVRRGNHLSIHGDPVATKEAAEILRALYARLEAGRAVEPADIDREMRMGASEKGTGSQAGDQMDLGVGDRIEIKTRKKLVEPRTAAQKVYVKSLFKNELAFGIGPAGTGKTYLAVAVGVNLFIGGHVEKIILSRPAVEAGEKLGYLPGDMKDKVDPYMQPLYDALNDFLPQKQVEKLIEEKKIEIAPLAFMRGRTLSRAFVVLDEAQNATAMQMKMFLTRLGEGSRMVVTGDRTQIDLPRGVPSGLRDAERLLGNIPKISFNYFTSKDVVRHPLVASIIEAYEADELPQLSVDIIIEDTRWANLLPLAQRACDGALAGMGLDPSAFEISLLACDDPRIAALNADFRQKGRATNVLSWPSEERGAVVEGDMPIPPRLPIDAELGDIAISFDSCAREAADAKIPFEHHVTHLIVHGTLHLLGFDHVRDGDATLMEGLEVEILSKLDIADPYS